MKKNSILITVMLMLAVVIIPNVNAANIYAVSPSYADVSAALSRTQSGDMVIVPAGTATWTRPLIIRYGITLKGAGQGKTMILSGFTPSRPTNTFDETNYLVVYRPANNTLNEPFRITGFTFDFSNRTSGILLKNLSSIKINKIRIDNNIIKNAVLSGGSARGIQVYGTVYGVIDNNEFSGNFKNIDSYGFNKNAWEYTDFNFGTEDCMYYEDNKFTISTTAHSAGAGGRYCARYNTYNYYENLNLYPWFDIHGNMGTNGNYSAMGSEIYGNLLISHLNRNGGIFDHRGGKAVIFSNKVVSTSSWSAKAREEHDDSLNPTTNPLPQHVSDSYYWNNRRGTTLVRAVSANSSGAVYRVADNRDFYNQNLSFDGTTGIGCGTLSSRPKKCSRGVAYWVTNQPCTSIEDASVGANPTKPLSGTLYKCTSSGVWSAYFTPYTYPHPLRSGL